MALWKCSQCGYEKSGPCRPPECPECKGPKDGFLKAEAAAPGKDGQTKKTAKKVSVPKTKAKTTKKK